MMDGWMLAMDSEEERVESRRKSWRRAKRRERKRQGKPMHKPENSSGSSEDEPKLPKVPKVPEVRKVPEVPEKPWPPAFDNEGSDVDVASDVDSVVDREDNEDKAEARHVVVHEPVVDVAHEEGGRGDREEQDDPRLVRLVAGFATIKCTSYVSDAAMEKIFKLVCSCLDDIKTLLQDGVITDSYINSIKPASLKGLPDRFLAVHHERDRCARDGGEDVEGEGAVKELVIERRLTSIPVDFLHGYAGKVTCIEGYVPLRGLVDLYRRVHLKKGLSAEDIRQNLLSATLSVDGVEESPKSQRSFIITSIMFGGCVYILRILSYLKGDKDSKQGAEGILR